MRLSLTKAIVRNATAYKFARAVTDGFFLTAVCLAVVNAGVGVFYFQRVAPATEEQKGLMVLMLAGYVFASFLFIVGACLTREFIQAVFDIADCALLDRKTPGTGENPFTA